jgi:hypothetical protein
VVKTCSNKHRNKDRGAAAVLASIAAAQVTRGSLAGSVQKIQNPKRQRRVPEVIENLKL